MLDLSFCSDPVNHYLRLYLLLFLVESGVTPKYWDSRIRSDTWILTPCKPESHLNTDTVESGVTPEYWHSGIRSYTWILTQCIQELHLNTDTISDSMSHSCTTHPRGSASPRYGRAVQRTTWRRASLRCTSTWGDTTPRPRPLASAASSKNPIKNRVLPQEGKGTPAQPSYITDAMLNLSGRSPRRHLGGLTFYPISFLKS